MLSTASTGNRVGVTVFGLDMRNYVTGVNPYAIHTPFSHVPFRKRITSVKCGF